MPRGQRARLDSDMCARIDRSTCLVEPSCSEISHSCFTHVSAFSIVHRESLKLCPHFCLHFGFGSPALEVRTETDLHLLGLLILSLCVSSWIIGTCLRMLHGEHLRLILDRSEPIFSEERLGLLNICLCNTTSDLHQPLSMCCLSGLSVCFRTAVWFPSTPFFHRELPISSTISSRVSWHLWSGDVNDSGGKTVRTLHALR